MHVGRLDPWRTDAQPDAARVREMAERIELRGQAPAEIATRQAYLDLLEPRAGSRVLDVGCGTGVVTRELARRVQPGGTVLGIDPNPDMLRVAKELADSDNMEFQPGDALTLPVDSSSFDVVTCITVLEHMPEPERAIPELVRALKPGGRLGVLCGDQESFLLNHPDRAMTRRIIATFADVAFSHPWIGRSLPGLLEQAGLEGVQATAFPTVDRDPTRFAMRAARLRAEVVAGYGAITDAERDAWLRQLDANTGSFLAGSVYLFSWGTRP
jgi:SAM-dependent methyltransferase